MKLIISVILLFTFYNLCFADEAPVVPVSGGTVKPVNNNDIQLKNEIINISLEQGRYYVEVIYTFKNFGGDQKITMGFPNQTNTLYTSGIKDFIAYEGNNKLAVYKKYDSVDSEMKDSMFYPRTYYECSDVFFKKDEVKTIKNIYSQQYETDYNESFRKVKYILTTGSFWKDKIESIVINIDIEGIPDYDLQKREAFFFESEPDIYEAVNLSPDGFVKKENVFTNELKDIDPESDIEIYFPPELIGSITTSSVLEPKSLRYGSQNISDNNEKTAWVEGIPGSGVGEWIQMDITPSTAGGKIEGCYNIYKIGIANGYAKDTTTFIANNRVKTLKISYEYFYNEELLKGEKDFIITLQDQMKMQYIKFEKPIKASRIHFTISDIYNGNKFDDTCLSEIILFTTNH